MPEFELIHRRVLDPAEAVVSERIRLEPLREGTILQVFGTDASQLATFARGHRLSLRANGPGQWYLVGDEPGLALNQRPAGFIFTDQSHGRVRIAVEGAVARDVLAKGTGVNLSTLAVGDASTALFGHIAAHITCVSPDGYELMPLRGFAESLWHDLKQMAAEFTTS